ncbi:MAG: hypothetical protein ABI288_10630 [Ginsengibacter sp.]
MPGNVIATTLNIRLRVPLDSATSVALAWLLNLYYSSCGLAVLSLHGRSLLFYLEWMIKNNSFFNARTGYARYQ